MASMVAATLSAYSRTMCLGMLLSVAGCASKPATMATASPPPVVASAPPVAGPQPPRTAPSGIIPGSAQDFRVNVGDTVHFAFDKYTVQSADNVTLQRQAAWLSKYPKVRVTVEGHADERGTREYNLALGARRANAVKEFLVSMGIATARIDTISYGKERPLCTESNETCWARNRRGMTIVAGNPASS